jgi:hypothetical protein
MCALGATYYPFDPPTIPSEKKHTNLVHHEPMFRCEMMKVDYKEYLCIFPQPENCISSYEPHAYCVVYSTVDRASLRCAEETLQFLWKSDTVSSKAVILVGNKTDLVRSRTVTTEGKSQSRAKLEEISMSKGKAAGRIFRNGR